jgi:hypothetical protein
MPLDGDTSEASFSAESNASAPQRRTPKQNKKVSKSNVWTTPADRRLQIHESKIIGSSEPATAAHATKSMFAAGSIAGSGNEARLHSSHLAQLVEHDQGVWELGASDLRRLQEKGGALDNGMASGPVSLRPVAAELRGYAAGKLLTLAVEVCPVSRALPQVGRLMYS